MFRNFIFIGILFLSLGKAYCQHSVTLKAVLNDSLKTWQIDQEITYHNTSQDTLQVLYLNDWINAFKDKSTPLAKRFSENYYRRFHLARKEEWGSTFIYSISQDSKPLRWERPETEPDLIKINLDSVLLPGEKVHFSLEYALKIPNDKFTRYGYSDDGKYQLNNWYITPSVYDGKWEVYSNKNLNDLFTPKMDIDLTITIPKYLAAISALEIDSMQVENKQKTIHFTGKNRLKTSLFLTRNYLFEEYDFQNLTLVTNMEDDGLEPPLKHRFIKRVLEFLNRRLGTYPHQNMMVTQEDYLNNPMYGLTQLPKFLRPFPEGFSYDLKQLKSITGDYLENTLLLNLRTEKWVFDAIQTYLMMEYVQENYPDMKVLGKLSEVFGLRWFHAADLKFNDQYTYFYMMTARNNMDQPLDMPQDSLVKFNRTIANAYKAGVGMKYLEAFEDKDAVSQTIKEFYNIYKLKPVSASDFEATMKQNFNKDINWFFEDYIGSNKNIDFKIRKVKKQHNKLKVSIKNKTQNDMPVTLYGLKKNKVVYKTWVEHIEKDKTVTIPADDIDRLALNYDGVIPEINQRDNFYAVKTILDKPLQLRLLKDVEDPHYRQLFLMPWLEFNLYDGISFGPKLYNQTVLEKPFEFNISPMYGSKSQTLVGSASFSHEVQFENEELYSIRYGASASRFSYGYNLFYEKFTPFLSLSFREKDLRDNRRQYLLLRNINVYRDQNLENPFDAPNYSIFNINYSYRDPGMVDYLTGNTDFQLSKQFSKFSLTMEYRKLYKNNRQINLRFFAGAFLYNDLTDTNYFSFALDRPTDYLYDYNYYGRSETNGLFSQQIIMAEGGFKSKLKPKYANQWLTSVNASTNIWKWIYLYSDLGLVKNEGFNARFLYDAGIRLSFVADYFEVYFPVYSNLGWEIGQENYDQKIRFIVTLDIPALAKLFSREWR